MSNSLFYISNIDEHPKPVRWCLLLHQFASLYRNSPSSHIGNTLQPSLSRPRTKLYLSAIDFWLRRLSVIPRSSSSSGWWLSDDAAIPRNVTLLNFIVWCCSWSRFHTHTQRCVDFRRTLRGRCVIYTASLQSPQQWDLPKWRLDQ